MKPVSIITRQLQSYLCENLVQNGSVYLVRRWCDGWIHTKALRVGSVYAPSTRLKLTYITDRKTGETSWEVTSTKGTFNADRFLDDETSPSFCTLLLECGRTYTVATPTLETVCLVTVYKDGLKYHPVEEKYE